MIEFYYLLYVYLSWSRDPTRDILVWPGHTATITARPVLVDHQGHTPIIEIDLLLLCGPTFPSEWKVG